MNTDNIRLIRRVAGRRGSVSLYQCPRRLAEVVRVTEEGTDVLELHQHEQEMLAPLLNYLDQVQKGIDASRPAKRTRTRWLGGIRRYVEKESGATCQALSRRRGVNGQIERAFIGRLGQDPELNTSAAGKSKTRLSLDKVGFPVPAKSRLIAMSTPIIECEDGIAPDKKRVIGRNPDGASMTIAAKPAGLPSAAYRQQLPVRAGSSKPQEVRRGASEGVR